MNITLKESVTNLNAELHKHFPTNFFIHCTINGISIVSKDENDFQHTHVNFISVNEIMAYIKGFNDAKFNRFSL